MKKYLTEILAVLLVCLAAPVLIHQHVTTSCPIWFHFSEIKSHEVIASFCIVAAIFMVVGKYLGKH